MKKILRLFVSILGAHFAAIFLSFVIQLFFGNLTNKIGLTGIICALIYIGAVYSVGWNQGKRDSRKITGVSPDVKSNALAGLCLSGITLILLIIRVAVFHIAAGGVVTADKPGSLLAADVIYRLWNYPFVEFMQSGTLFSYIVPAVLPFVIYTLAYIFGVKRFSLADDVFRNIIYKKENKK